MIAQFVWRVSDSVTCRIVIEAEDGGLRFGAIRPPG